MQLDVLIQPVVLRFSLHHDEVVYHFAGSADAQLDRMELAMGIDPGEDELFDSNLGFLPVATTVLLRGERTVVVDPGNHHTGFYGQLGLALRRCGVDVDDVDAVVCTHCHHDHMASIFKFPGADLVMGEDEIDFAKTAYGKGEIEAKVDVMGAVTEVPLGGELQLMEGVQVVSTAGHTPGHVSVVCDLGDQRVVVAGDAAMTRAEYERGEHSHWYTDEQRAECASSVDRLRSLDPSLVLPGHDRGFRPQSRTGGGG